MVSKFKILTSIFALPTNYIPPFPPLLPLYLHPLTYPATHFFTYLTLTQHNVENIMKNVSIAKTCQ
jgi:hypothetical protein